MLRPISSYPKEEIYGLIKTVSHNWTSYFLIYYYIPQALTQTLSLMNLNWGSKLFLGNINNHILYYHITTNLLSISRVSLSW